MKSIKQIILESLRYFRTTLLKDVAVQNDTKHALSCAGAFDLQNTVVRSITRSGKQFTAKNSAGATLFTFDQQDNNTTYSAGTGLSLSGTTFSLPNSGVTAGTYGPSGNVTGSNGVTINVPQITVNAQGKVTGLTNRVYTSVNTDTNTTYSDATTSAHGLMSAADKTKLNGIQASAKQVKLAYTDQKSITIKAGASTWAEMQKPSDSASFQYWLIGADLQDGNLVYKYSSTSAIAIWNRGTASRTVIIRAYWIGIHT